MGTVVTGRLVTAGTARYCGGSTGRHWEHVEHREGNEYNWVKLRNWNTSKCRHSYVAHKQHSTTYSTTKPLRKLQQVQDGRRRVLLAEEALLSNAARHCHSVLCSTPLSLCSGRQVDWTITFTFLLVFSRRPATSWVHYTTNCNTQSSAPEDGRCHRPKYVELIGIINKPLLLHLVGVSIFYIVPYIYKLFTWIQKTRKVTEKEII